jgi:hypothetical protein
MIPYLNRIKAPAGSISNSSANGFSFQHQKWIVRYGWILPIIVALAVYSVGVNNFFTFDDFIWLDRARTLQKDWLQIFRPDVMYFDPLVHFMFWINFMVAGLDPRWYHCADLVIHAINSLLVYRFARLLSCDDRASLYTGIMFASSFAIADAVLWPSSRVDLLATLFSLSAMIQFLLYLQSERMRNLFLSFLLFILSLCAKGTPLVLPLIFLWLVIQGKKPHKHVIRLIPFGAVVVLYVVLLKLTMHQASLPLNKLHFDIGNLALAFCALFIPDETLSHINLTIVAPLLFSMVTVLGLFAITDKSTINLRRTGYCIMLLSISPVLILTAFNLATKNSDPYLLLKSPSHRIYLASVGSALLGGGLLRSIEALLQNYLPKIATMALILFLAGVVTCNVHLVRERNKLWESAGDSTRIAFNGLSDYRHQVGEGSQIGLIYMPNMSGFTPPMIRLCFGIDDVTVIRSLTIGGKLIDDTEILKKAENSFLFILDSDGRVIDKSLLFRQQLLSNRMALLNPNHPEYLSSFLVISNKLYLEIKRINPPKLKVISE